MSITIIHFFPTTRSAFYRRTAYLREKTRNHAAVLFKMIEDKTTFMRHATSDKDFLNADGYIFKVRKVRSTRNQTLQDKYKVVFEINSSSGILK